MVIDEPMDDLTMQWIGQWQHGLAERSAQARALTERTSSLTATAREGDGIVEVAIGSGGQIASLRLDEEIRRQPAATTTRQILEAIRSAKISLASQFEQAAAATVALDNPTGQALIKSLDVRLGLGDHWQGDE